MRWNRSRRVYKQISLPPIVPSLEQFWPTLKLSAQDRPVSIPVPPCSPGRFPSFPCQHWLCALPPACSPAAQGIPVARCLAAFSPCPLAARLQAGAHPAPLQKVPVTLTSSCGSSQCTCREETQITSGTPLCMLAYTKHQSWKYTFPISRPLGLVPAGIQNCCYHVYGHLCCCFQRYFWQRGVGGEGAVFERRNNPSLEGCCLGYEDLLI